MIPLPTYYSRLQPFEDYFATGIPILTYHKVGPRPWGARLKGLYASPRFFDRQMSELHQGGFESCALNAVSAANGRPPRAVVITFDDGFLNVLQHGLAPLARTGFRAIEFLVSNRLGAFNDWEMVEGERPERLMEASQIRDWLAAGHEIGSHTLTHPYLTRISTAVVKEEIGASKKILEDLFGRPVCHFCYPYGDYNQAISDLVQEAGYETACTTRAGINTASTDPFQLLRFTARYPSRSLRAMKEWVKRMRPSRI